MFFKYYAHNFRSTLKGILRILSYSFKQRKIIDLLAALVRLIILPISVLDEVLWRITCHF